MIDNIVSGYTPAQTQQAATYLRLGPVWGRVHQLGVVLLLVLIWGAVGFTFATVQSFYPGTGVVYSTPEEKPVVGKIKECRRVGPLSVDGFGYWWHCRASIQSEGGRSTEIVLDRSIAPPSDIGKEVALREACFGDGHTECSYGLPTNRAWGVGARALSMVEWAVSIFLLLCVVLYTLRSLLGVPRYFEFVNRLSKNRDVKEIPNLSSKHRPVTDSAAINLTVSYPPGAFLYSSRTPRVQVDGKPADLPGWGTHRLEVPAGRRRLQVWVPYFMSRKAGKAQLDVTVAPGEEVMLEYMAPSVSFGRGSLGAPGEQKSTGYSTVMLFNVLAVVIVVVLLMVSLVG